MKIVRNGIEYELTETELHEAYREREKLYLIDEIRARMKEMKIAKDSVDMDMVLFRAQSAIDDDDYLWYCHSRDIDYAIEYEIESNNKED